MKEAGVDGKSGQLTGEQSRQASLDGDSRTTRERPRCRKSRRRTVRFRLTCLVLACVLPVCITATFLVYYSYRNERSATERRVLETARALSMVVDRELANMEGSAAALATSPLIASGDLAGFYRQMQAVLRNYPHGVFILSDATGRQLVNSLVPFGAPLPDRVVSDVMKRVFSGKPGVTNMFQGSVMGRRVFAVEVPVFRGNRVVYDLVMAFPVDHLSQVFSQQRLPPEWTASIQDANHVIVARNRFPQDYVGRQGNRVLGQHMDEDGEGAVEISNLEGTRVDAIFSRSPTSGWSVMIGVPETFIRAHTRKWLGWTIAGVILVSLLGLGLALILARRMAESIEALIPPALSLGSGEPVDIGQLDLEETNKVGQSLIQASELLKQRAAERERAEAVRREAEELERANTELQRREADAQAHAAQLSAIVTELKAAEEELRCNGTRLRLALEAAKSGTWEWNLQTNQNTWSYEIWSLYGLEPNSCEPSFESWLSTVHPEDRALAGLRFQEAAASCRELNVEYRVLDRNGGVRWLALRGRALFDGEGTAASYIGIAMDITDHKLAEQALIRSEKLASVGRMAATIAHEINNPLAAVTNSLFIAKAVENLPDVARRYLETADEELKRVAHITRQALGFYRESNVAALTSVNALMDSALDLLKSKIKAKHAVIEKQWNTDVQVNAVAGELRQVFSNLLANSLDAIDDRGVIKLRVSTRSGFEKGDRQVRITIADNGKGISAKVQQNIFEPFFTTKGTVGTGLGLWVSKEIIDKHAGTIQVRSSTDGSRRGTVVAILLPIKTGAGDARSAVA